MIDLHTHSNVSDGSFSPAGLMREAAKRSLSAIALTDHDTIDGLAEAAGAAAELGLRFIPGVELEIAWETESGGEFHLLGLDIKRPSENFLASVDELARRREERNLEIIDKMNKAGIAVTYDEIREIAGVREVSETGKQNAPVRKYSIGRPHFAAFLVKRKIAKNREQAFLRYIGRGKPCYAPKAGLEFERAATAIHESGGIAVLAHPMSLYVAWGKLPGLVESLKERGLDGIEAWHPTAKTGSCLRLEELGKKLGLRVTAGSDFHGEARGDRKLGITSGGRKINDSFLEAIPAALS